MYPIKAIGILNSLGVLLGGGSCVDLKGAFRQSGESFAVTFHAVQSLEFLFAFLYYFSVYGLNEFLFTGRKI